MLGALRRPGRAHVEPSWVQLGLMLGQVGPMLRHRAHLGPILAQVGPMLGPSWAHVRPMLGLCWAYVGHVEPSWELCWGHVWAIYVETPLRCQFFRPRPPLRAQNHVKTEVFQHRQDEIPCRRIPAWLKLAFPLQPSLIPPSWTMLKVVRFRITWLGPLCT